MITKPKYLLIPIVYMVTMYAIIFLLDGETTAWITEEDRIIEYLTSLYFFTASVMSFISFITIWKMEGYTLLRKLSYLGLALIFLFGAGEEISWGQRIFNIAIPDTVSNANYQNELTMHNLNIFDEIGIDITDIFNLFWLSFTLLIPLSAAVIPKLRGLYEKFMPIVPWVFGLMFFGNWMIAEIAGDVYRSGVSVSYIIHDIVETKENNYAILFAVVSIFLFYTLKPKTVEQENRGTSSDSVAN